MTEECTFRNQPTMLAIQFTMASFIIFSFLDMFRINVVPMYHFTQDFMGLWAAKDIKDYNG